MCLMNWEICRVSSIFMSAVEKYYKKLEHERAILELQLIFGESANEKELEKYTTQELLNMHTLGLMGLV